MAKHEQGEHICPCFPILNQDGKQAAVHKDRDAKVSASECIQPDSFVHQVKQRLKNKTTRKDTHRAIGN